MDLFFKKITHKNLSHQVRIIREAGYDVGLSVVLDGFGRYEPRLVILNHSTHTGCLQVMDYMNLRGDHGKILTFRKKASVMKLVDKHQLKVRYQDE